MSEELFNEYIQETTDFINGTIKKKYLLDDETCYEDIINKRFKNELIKIEPNTSRINYILNMFNNKTSLPAGSILSGLGNTEHTTSLSNCYYTPIESDSIEGIYECQKKLAKTFSRRGGSGTSITILRPKGTPVSNSAKTSTGAVSFMPGFSLLAHDIGQNGRRAALIITIDCRHPDVLDFIWCKSKPELVFDKDSLTDYQPNISYANISIEVTNDFMEAAKNDADWDLFFPDTSFEKYDEEWNGDYNEWLEKGYPTKVYKTIKARDLLNQIAEAAWLTGDPGLSFKDNVIKYSTGSFDPKIKPKGLNPCLPSWAPILTPNGYTQFKNVQNEIFIQNQKYKCSDLILTNSNDEVFQLTLESGLKFYSNKDHIVSTTNGDKKFKYLTLNNKICCDYSPIINKINLIKFNESNWKFENPLNRSLNYQINYVIAAIETDLKHMNYKSILKDNKINIHNITSEFNFEYIQLILASLGIYSVYDDNNIFYIPDLNTFKNIFDYKLFDNENIKEYLKNIKFSNHSFAEKYFQKIRNIIKLKETYPVYDIQVPDKHYFVCGSVVTHNCGEQTLQDYGNCLLSCLCLHKYVKNPYTPDAEFDLENYLLDVEHLVYFLDLMIDINKHPLPEQVESDLYSRRIGIEFTGLHDMWAMLNLDYGSDKACEFIDDILFTKAVHEIKISIKLAKEKGHAPCFKYKKSRQAFIDQPYIQRILKKLLKTNREEIINDILNYGLRNSAFNTVGPTGTLSIISDNCSSGIEPIYNISYERESRLFPDKKMKVVHLPLVKNIGSEILNLSEDEIKKKYHYTSTHDIDFNKRIKVQSTIQKWIDNSISSTINLNNDATIEDIYKIYTLAYEKKLKGITVYRDGCKKGILSLGKEPKVKEKKSLITSNMIKEHINFERPEILKVHRSYRYVKFWKKIKVYISVTIDNTGKPFEIFANLPLEAGINNSMYQSELLMEKRSQWEAICRLSSMLLRLNTPVELVIKQLEKSSPIMTEASNIVAQVLKGFVDYSEDKIEEIKTKKIGGMYCDNCQTESIIYQGGCEVCLNCGDSRCG